MSHAAEQKVRGFIAAEREHQIGSLAELVKTPSDNPPGDCAAFAEKAASLLEAFGWPVERHPVAPELARAAGMRSCTNLVVRRRFGEGPVIALNAHGDVVPPGAGWSTDPYGAEMRDGHMYGRGVAVSKSDIATYAWALRALEQSGVPLKGTVELHVTCDEESGGDIGPRLLLEQGISKPDVAIAAGFSYAVVHAHNGCLHLEVEMCGRSAHAAKPWTGIDALEAATAVLSTLYASRPALAGRVSAIAGIGSPQLTVGLINGGINTNVVPDRVVFRLDRRVIPEEDLDEVQRQLEALIEQALPSGVGAHATVRRILAAEPLRPSPAGERITRILCQRATAVMGEPVTTSGVPLYTDARHYAARDIPTVLYGAGPRALEDANAHRADERLAFDDLGKATTVVALALLDLLSA